MPPLHVPLPSLPPLFVPWINTSIPCARRSQVEQFKAWLPGFHCRCGERFRYIERGSRQVGAAAVWEVQCAGGCAPLHLATSPSLFSDDYEINYTLQHGCELCAVPFGRASDLLRYAGLGQLSERDNNATKAELEQPLAHAAHTAMARAWEEEQLAGVTKSEGCLCLDDGWNHGRNGSECTQPVMSATTGRKRWKPPQAVPIQLSTAAGASSSSAVAVPDAAAAAAALCDLSAVAPAQSSTARGKRKAVPESGVGGSPVERVVCALKDLGDEISMHTLQQHTQLDRGTLRGALKVMESQNQCMVRGDIVHMI